MSKIGESICQIIGCKYDPDYEEDTWMFGLPVKQHICIRCGRITMKYNNDHKDTVKDVIKKKLKRPLYNGRKKRRKR